MYPSDYGYASNGSQETCEGKEMYKWDTGEYKTECAEKSWLYDSNNWQWTLTPRSDYLYGAFYVDITGCVGYNGNVGYDRAVRPVLYLKSNVKIVGGNGTVQQPFILGA